MLATESLAAAPEVLLPKPIAGQRGWDARDPPGAARSGIQLALLALSEGSLGELSVLLTSAAVYAMRSGTERIDAKVLAAIDWVPPSERRRRAERLI